MQNAKDKDNLLGLTFFISDVRRCASKESEQKLINRELANIRTKFFNKKALTATNLRKTISKLLFIHLLGYNVDFALSEAIICASTEIFQNKYIGYIFITVVLTSENISSINQELIEVFNTDINSLDYYFSSIALRVCANISCSAVIDALYDSVYKKCFENTKKEINTCAFPCLYSMIRYERSLIVSSISEIQILLNYIENENPALQHFSLHLLEQHLIVNSDKLQWTLTTILKHIYKIIYINTTNNCGKDVQKEFKLYKPWTFVKLIKILRYYQHETFIKINFDETISKLIVFIRVIHKELTMLFPYMIYGIIFEIVTVLLMTEFTFNINELLAIVSKGISHTDPTIRGVSLKCIKSIMSSKYILLSSNFQQTAIQILRSDQVFEIRKIAFDICYLICDGTIIKALITDMISFVSLSSGHDQQDSAIKVSYLAEKFSPSSIWYVENMINLIQSCGEFLGENTWSRIVSIITSRQKLKVVGTKKLYEILHKNNVNENIVKLGAYVIGECSQVISEDPDSTPKKQLVLLSSWYWVVSNQTKCVLISAFSKFLSLYPELKFDIKQILKKYNVINNIDVEIQQRGLEAYMFSKIRNRELLKTIFTSIPPFENSREICLSNIFDDKIDSSRTTKTSSNISSGLGLKKSKTLKIHNVQDFVEGNRGVWFAHTAISASLTISQTSSETGEILSEVSFSNHSKYEIKNIQIGKSTVQTQNYLSFDFPECETLEPSTKASVKSFVKLNAPYSFQNPEVVSFEFTIQNISSNFRCIIPILLHHFIFPKNASIQEFLSEWKHLIKETSHQIELVTQFDKEKLLKSLKKLHFNFIEYRDKNQESFYCSAQINISNSKISILMIAMATHSFQPGVIQIRSINREICQELDVILRKMLND